VFKIVPVDWKRLKFKQLSLNRAEEDTRKFDAECMKYLSYVLYPLCAGAAVYSLIYEPQKRFELLIRFKQKPEVCQPKIIFQI